MTPRQGQRIAVVLGAVGLIIGIIAALGDVLGIGKTPEFFGRYQFLAVTFGMVLLVIATVFASIGAGGGRGVD
nr:hypothetical protein [Anaerolineae bacterium]